jgi:DNA-binding CsgD family transcriptional regulator/Tfp pilus assembly protein PilF
VKDAVLARFVQLSCAARELSEVVSLVPGRAEISLTRAVVCDGAGSGEDIDEAIARGLLKHQDGSLSFRHELARLAVEQSVPSARAERWHRAILEALTAGEADLSRRVHHAVQGREVAAVLDYAPRAAEQAAAAGAHREAASHWATALRFADALESGVRARFLEEHANESAMINATEAAIESGSAALALWHELNEVEAQGRMQILLAYTYWKAGNNVLADRYVHDAITLLEQHAPSRVLAMAYSVRSQRAMTGGHVTEALGYGQRAINLAVTFDDAATRSHALNNIGATLLACGDESGIHHLEQSLAIALHKGLHEHAGRAYANLVSVAVGQRMSVLARRYFTQAIEYCDRHEVQDCLTYVLAWGAQMELNDGHWAEAAKMAAEVLECQTPAVAQRIPALQALGLLRARRGDPGADALLEEAMALSLPTGEFQRIGPLACALAELAFYRGDLARVRAEAERGLESGQHRQDAWILGELAFWAKVGGSDAALPAYIAEPYRCLVAGEYREAAERWEDLNAPYERALALSYGGKQDLLLALGILETLGNGPLTAIVRQKLRNLGVRGIPRGQRASTRKNPAGLTTREVQVLSLLVHGHTNAELAQRMHVAPKTVEHHVSSILEKLAVESRTEAVAAAFGLGIVKPEAKGGLQ